MSFMNVNRNYLTPFYDCSILSSQHGYKIFCDTTCVLLDPRQSMDFFWEWKEKSNIIPLQNLAYVALHGNGTARDKVTVIGRDQIGSLGQTDGTNKNPMWAGVNGTHQEKVVRDCESRQFFNWDWEWNDEILMWACVTGTTLNKFLDLYYTVDQLCSHRFAGS